MSMEDNMLTGSMIPGSSTYGGLDLQGSSQINHHQQHSHGLRQQNQAWQGSVPHQSMHEAFPLTMAPNSMADFNKMERGKNSGSDEEEGIDKGKKVSVWHRVKWTDAMVRLLITAVSYIGEDAVSECGSGMRRKFANLHKKGKWKTISRVMAERGFYVSPQQSEDKFNDLNKRYKKLNDILGRGTSCQVVENPSLLNLMDHLSDKVKDEVRKILSSKQLFYEEMCSYHNCNRLHLPHDPALLRSLQLAVQTRDHDLDEDDHDAETDEHEDYEENCCSKGLQSQNPHGDTSLVFPEGTKAALLQRRVQLEEQKVQLEMEMLELEKQKLKWEKFSSKKERELEKRKMVNERMKLENERMGLELKRMEMSVETNERV